MPVNGGSGRIWLLPSHVQVNTRACAAYLSVDLYGRSGGYRGGEARLRKHPGTQGVTYAGNPSARNAGERGCIGLRGLYSAFQRGAGCPDRDGKKQLRLFGGGRYPENRSIADVSRLRLWIQRRAIWTGWRASRVEPSGRMGATICARVF